MTESDPFFDVCGATWDDRDDPSIPKGQGYDCNLDIGHYGPHRFGDFEWEKR